MKRCGLILLLLVVSLWGMAQTRTISGSLFDAESKEGVPFAAVQLHRQDSSYVVGTTTNFGVFT